MTDMSGPDPYTIRLWLALKLSDGRADTLYTRDIRTAHTPRKDSGDTIHLWQDTDDIPHAEWHIHRAYTDHTGRYNIELTPLLVDPNPESLDRMRRAGYQSEAPWYAEGTYHLPHTLLEAAGWTEWDGS